jgi:hypothetical protein
MRILKILVFVLTLMAMAAGSAQAGSVYYPYPESAEVRRPAPGSAAIAASANLVYAPARLVLTVIDAWLGGLTGFLTAGDANAARDVANALGGTPVITPEIIRGEERMRFGQFGF